MHLVEGVHQSLSQHIADLRLQLLGGGHAEASCESLRAWIALAAQKGRKAPSPRILAWAETLAASLERAGRSGARTTDLISALLPLVRREEVRWRRVHSIEGQLGFQAALALVLPWAVLAFVPEFEWSSFMAAAVLLQSLGISFFSWLIYRQAHPKLGEASWIFETFLPVWMDLLSGLTLISTLDHRLRARRTTLEPSFQVKALQVAWVGWLENVQRQTGLFCWPKNLNTSETLSSTLATAIYSGAPLADGLRETLIHFEDLEQIELEERLAALPTKISLINCAFFAPAFFLVLLGCLWPTLRWI